MNSEMDISLEEDIDARVSGKDLVAQLYQLRIRRSLSRLINQGMHYRLHHRRTNTVSEKSDAVAARADR